MSQNKVEELGAKTKALVILLEHALAESIGEVDRAGVALAEIEERLDGLARKLRAFLDRLAWRPPPPANPFRPARIARSVWLNRDTQR